MPNRKFVMTQDGEKWYVVKVEHGPYISKDQAESYINWKQEINKVSMVEYFMRFARKVVRRQDKDSFITSGDWEKAKERAKEELELER